VLDLELDEIVLGIEKKESWMLPKRPERRQRTKQKLGKIARPASLAALKSLALGSGAGARRASQCAT
jgi:hypothetical protein